VLYIRAEPYDVPLVKPCYERLGDPCDEPLSGPCYERLAEPYDEPEQCRLFVGLCDEPVALITLKMIAGMKQRRRNQWLNHWRNLGIPLTLKVGCPRRLLEHSVVDSVLVSCPCSLSW
jgi:hypothetical protein